MSYWIDTHAHIYHEDFSPDVGEMLHRSEQAGVRKIFMPNIDHTSIEAMMNLESRHTNCLAMMGLHPCYVKKDFERELYIVEDWLSKRTFAAIGEIGTDLYWDETYWEQQKEAFAIQVNWAIKYQLPIVIHCRNSIDQTIEMVEQSQDGALTGVFHCFSGSAEQAERIAKLNFYMGIGGVATFKKGGLDSVLPAIPLNQIVLETDCPYLAPVPHRGKRNEPAYIPLIAQRVAEIKNVSVEELQKQTTANAISLFQQNP